MSSARQSPVREVEPVARRPRPNADRTRETRTRLLLAAVDTLIERGYAATTVAAVQERAGVSRGAVLHHFPTKATLLVDAVEYLADAQVDELNEQAARHPREAGDTAQQRLAIWLSLTWSCFASPLFTAVLELWIASRTEPDLRRHLVPYERRLGGRLRDLAETIFPDRVFDEEWRVLYDATLVYYRGLAVSALLGIDGAEQERQRAVWATLLSVRPERLSSDRP
jgi:AcrR family transcriptional regulator